MVITSQKTTTQAGVEQLLARLQSQNIKVWVTNGQLHTRAAAGVITPELRAQLQQWKAELILLLSRAENQTIQTPIPTGQRPATLPLSFAQQRLWFMDIVGSGTAYNIPLSVQLQGKLNLSALNQAFSEIVRRHESLRTTFSVVREASSAAGNEENISQIGTVHQVIHPVMPVVMPVVDLSELAPDEQAQRVQQLKEAETIRPFDLQQDLMLRVQLLRLGEDHHLLLLTIHHIAADGWSLGILVREVTTLYAAFSQGRPSPLPELTIQYADFALWQRNHLQGEVLEGQLKWWVEHLAGTPPLLQLPSDRPRPPQPSYRGSTIRVEIDAQLSGSVRQLSHRQGCTLYMTLLAAFQVLLYRYTGQGEIIVASPIANRNRAELEPMIGFFANTLALRSSMVGNPTFLELLTQVQQQVQAAYDHQELPFERLVEALQIERNLSYSPLVQVVFALQNMPMDDFTLSGLQPTSLVFELQNTRFDLELYVREVADRLHLYCVYSHDLFEANTIERLLGHYQQILKSIVANPTQSIATLPMFTQAERHQLLFGWNTTLDFGSPQTIHALFEQQVERTPDAVAVVMPDEQRRETRGWKLSASQSLTYAELNARANQLAHHLIELGVGGPLGPDTLVAVAMERSIEMIVSLLAVLKAGCAYVPIDPTYPKDRIHFMLADSAAPILLTQSHLLWMQEAAPTIRHIIAIDTMGAQWGGQPTTNPQTQTTPTNLAYVIYTSGSTGQPKGVLIEHQNLFYSTAARQAFYKSTGLVSFLLLSPISFDSSVAGIFWTLTQGAKLVLPENQLDMLAIAKLINQQAITHLVCVPTLYSVLLSHSDSQVLTGLKVAIIAGESGPQNLLALHYAKLPNTQLFNEYGPTEATVWCSGYAYQHSEDRLTCIGRPIANTQIYILDHNCCLLPPQIPGELYIGGVQLARGYLNRPELTAERFIQHPEFGRLYKTGDLCRWLPDGNIEYLGRTDFQVKIRGFRIELGEIESALLAQEGVCEAVVLAREDTPGDKRLVAYLVAEANVATVRQALAQRLPDYMVPTAFVHLDAMPLTPNGKLDRKALPAPDASSFATKAVYTRPSTPTEIALVEIWNTTLGLEQVGIHDSFFALGGHSLLATQVIFRIREKLGVDLPLRQLFATPTIAALADYLDTVQLLQNQSTTSGALVVETVYTEGRL